MCGIAGFVGSSLPIERRESVLRLMTDSLFHRGPDGAGYYVDHSVGLGLGHRRLAIIDLSSEGQQPMTSRSGRYMVTFNGEVYNFEELRKELVGHGCAFRGHSDTEVMLAMFEEWGIECALSRFNGMFALAVWDCKDQRFWLIRDRLGKKPLYYADTGAGFIFGSELKVLAQYPGFSPSIDRNSMCLYMRHNCIPAPHTIYEGVKKLEPGSFLCFEIKLGKRDPLRHGTYWSAADVYAKNREQRFKGCFEEATNELDSLLRDSIKLRMNADVPLGVFLSGGIDSSVIAALMQAQSVVPIKSFTIGFNESDYSEARHAAAVAKHLGTDHTELLLEPSAALDLVPKLPYYYDEPFADSSQLPTILVSALARQRVTVALSGDGGDEFFSGYNRYMWLRKVWNITHKGPRWARRCAAAALLSVSAPAWDSMLSPILKLTRRQQAVGDRLHKLAAVLREDDPARVYLRLVTHWERPENVVIGGHEPPTLASAPHVIGDIDEYIERIMYLDTVTYLPDDIMVKVDRASMSVSLEVRAPLMDYRLLEFSSSLPLSFKNDGVKGKRVLREVLYKYVPRELLDRPKVGFGIPLDAWLRGPLREWAESLLCESALRTSEMFHVGTVRKVWEQHLSGRFQHQYLLWDVLMFQAWQQCWSKGFSDVRSS